MYFLDPTNDVAFKKIFGNEKKKNILISFLNSILELPEHKKITDVEILNPWLGPVIKELKETILDVRCTDERGINYIVEMQVAKMEGFQKRVQYYSSKLYSNQLERGEDYPKLNQVIFLGITGFSFLETKNYVSHHLIMDRKTQEHALKDLEYFFVELPKFNKKEEELETIEDKWIYFLKNAKNLKIIPQNMQEKELKEAFKILDKFDWTKQEMELYDKVGIYKQDEIQRIEAGRKEGIEIGLKKGEELGLKKGEELGLKKGEELGLKKGEELGKIEIAKKLIESGMSIDEISKITGLDKKQIK